MIFHTISTLYTQTLHDVYRDKILNRIKKKNTITKTLAMFVLNMYVYLRFVR